jgi:hypothetical protein
MKAGWLIIPRQNDEEIVYLEAASSPFRFQLRRKNDLLVMKEISYENVAMVNYDG